MNKMLSRRNVLRGAGVALALPYLESLAPRRARAQTVVPKRFAAIYMPGGAGIEWNDITGSGANWQLGSLHEPFAAIKSKLLMIRNIGNYTWRNDLLTMSGPWDAQQERADYGTFMPYGSYVLPSHSRQPGGMLNCIDVNELQNSMGLSTSDSPFSAETMDQIIVRGTDPTPIPSMQLGLIDGPGAYDGKNAVFSQNMSWDMAGTPLGKDSNPQSVFDDLVAGGAVASDPMAGPAPDPAAVEAAARRQALNQSVLDSIQEQATTLQPKLATADRARLDQFLTGVEELEAAIAQVGGNPVVSTAGCNPIARPEAAIADFNLKAQVMNDLIVMAFQCDVTRVITYMMDHSRSETAYNWVAQRSYPVGAAVVDEGGTCGNYHACQHGNPRGAEFASICNWHMANVASLATKLDAIPEGEGTVLDNSILMYMSDMHHGDHAAWDLPIALFGSGGGTLLQDQYIVLEENPTNHRTLRDLHFTIMNQYFNLGVTSFGTDMRGMPNALIQEILA
jgi:hypothetical protein